MSHWEAKDGGKDPISGKTVWNVRERGGDRRLQVREVGKDFWGNTVVDVRSRGTASNRRGSGASGGGSIGDWGIVIILLLAIPVALFVIPLWLLSKTPMAQAARDRNRQWQELHHGLNRYRVEVQVASVAALLIGAAAPFVLCIALFHALPAAGVQMIQEEVGSDGAMIQVWSATAIQLAVGTGALAFLGVVSFFRYTYCTCIVAALRATGKVPAELPSDRRLDATISFAVVVVLAAEALWLAWIIPEGLNRSLWVERLLFGGITAGITLLALFGVYWGARFSVGLPDARWHRAAWRGTVVSFMLFVGASIVS
jgi:hypothetical protein